MGNRSSKVNVDGRKTGERNYIRSFVLLPLQHPNILINRCSAQIEEPCQLADIQLLLSERTRSRMIRNSNSVNTPEVAKYYTVWNGLRDTLEGYYKSAPRQHHPLSQQKEFRAIKNAIIQEAERLCLQLEQDQTQVCSENPIYDNKTANASESKRRLQSELLLSSTIRLFHQMSQIFRDNAAAPSNPMGIRADSKRRKKLLQKRLALGHKRDDHEEMQTYGQSIS